MIPRPASSFEKALRPMTAEERLRAARLRELLRLREDDALWGVAGLVKDYEAGMRKLPQRCAEAAARAVHETLAAADGSPGAPVRASRNGRDRELLVMTFVCLYIATAVLIGAACFTLGTVLQDGRVGWLPPELEGSSPVSYGLAAILRAPIGGLLATAAAGLVAVGAAVLWYRRRGRA